MKSIILIIGIFSRKVTRLDLMSHYVNIYCPILDKTCNSLTSGEEVCGISCENFENLLSQLIEDIENLKIENAEQTQQIKQLESSLVDENSTLGYAASCEELSELGYSKDGIYQIQPSRELEPFNVRCKFSDSEHGTVTVLEKTHEKRKCFKTRIFTRLNTRLN